MAHDERNEMQDNQELLDRVYGVERLEPCEHGHFDCAEQEGGSCANETYAKLLAAETAQPESRALIRTCERCGEVQEKQKGRWKLLRAATHNIGPHRHLFRSYDERNEMPTKRYIVHNAQKGQSTDLRKLSYPERGRAMTVAQQPNVTINFSRHAQGDVGPCSQKACPERATRRYDVIVNDVVMVAWICDSHGDDLAAIHAKA